MENEPKEQGCFEPVSVRLPMLPGQAGEPVPMVEI